MSNIFKKSKEEKIYEPFYSEVHEDVIEELKFRAQCGISDKRSDEQLEWMNSRTSWGSITILQQDSNGDYSVLAAINNKSLSANNNPTVEGNFLRGTKGIINDVKHSFQSFKGLANSVRSGARSFNATDPDYLASNYIHTFSGRTGPSLQQMTFKIVDESKAPLGQMNDATVTILVPSIEEFILDFEPTWFRLYNKCVLEIGHSVRLDRRPNYGRYEGQIGGFDFKYNKDGTVTVNITLKATTDIAGVLPIAAPITNQANEVTLPTTLGSYYDKLEEYAKRVFLTDNNKNVFHVFDPSFIETDYNLEISNYSSISSIESEFRNSLKNDGKKFRLKRNKTDDNVGSTYDIFMASIKQDVSKADSNTVNKKYYVSLGMLCKLISAQMLVMTKQARIQSVVDNITPTTLSTAGNYLDEISSIFDEDTSTSDEFTKLDHTIITAAPEFCQTLYFEELVSADHTKVILPGSNRFPSDEYFNPNWFKRKDFKKVGPAAAIEQQIEDGIPDQIGRLEEWTTETIETNRNLLDDITFYTELNLLSETKRKNLKSFVRSFLSNTDQLDNDLAIDSNSKVFGNISNILISIDEIREIEKSTQTTDKNNGVYDINLFIARICKLISDCTGGIIDLKLTTMPVTELKSIENNLNCIVFHDNTSSVPSAAMYNTAAVTLPIFANSLVSSYDTGGNVLATGYRRVGTVVRSFELSSNISDDLKSLSFILGQDTNAALASNYGPIGYSQAKTVKHKKLFEKEYSDSYQTNRTALRNAKRLYYNTQLNDDIKQNLKLALRKYKSTPIRDLSGLFNFSMPIWPIDVSLTLDGIYGFRFGDVITLNGLPSSFNNFVFTIIQADHTLTTDNDWSTTLKCKLRTRIEPPNTSPIGINKLFPNIIII